MDENREVLLLIGTSMVLLAVFSLTVLAVMLIYRKRKIQHNKEVARINEKYEKELLQTQLEVQKETMHHIGREIHDNVGHQLTLAFLYAQQVMQDDFKSHDQIKEIASIIDTSLTDLRSLSANLIHKNIISNTDLSTLLADECNKIRSARLCEVQCHISPIKVDISSEVNSFILRIAQEFIQNSLKHSKCQHIKIELNQIDNHIELKVSDDGKGFLLNSQLAKSKGVGLANMRKRAEIIGGKLFLESTLEEGTKMKLLIHISN